MIQNKEELIEQLHKGLCSVVFEKTDGEERTMKCTLNPIIAKSMPQTLQEQSNRAKNPNVIAVWDVEKDDWRAFRVDSVTSFSSTAQTLKG
jgi:hypothetical protein